MKLRFAGVVAAAVLINALTQVDGFFKEAPKKQTNTRKAKKARWKRSITWM
jgi:uridylate kinase